jgi:hypothetical protein
MVASWILVNLLVEQQKKKQKKKGKKGKGKEEDGCSINVWLIT